MAEDKTGYLPPSTTPKEEQGAEISLEIGRRRTGHGRDEDEDRAGAARRRTRAGAPARPRSAGPPRRSSARSGASTPRSPRSSSAGSPAASRSTPGAPTARTSWPSCEFLGDPLARRRDAALHRLGRRRPGLPRPDDRRRQGPQDDQPPHRLALQLLQVPPGGRLGVPPADHRPEPGARPVHPPRLVRPARRDQGPLGHPGPAAHGAALGRLGPRLPGPGDREVLPLHRGPDRHRLPAQGQGLPPGRRRGDDHPPREGRQAPPDRPPLRRGRGHRRVHREGGADQGAAVPGPAALQEDGAGREGRSAW